MHKSSQRSDSCLARMDCTKCPAPHGSRWQAKNTPCSLARQVGGLPLGSCGAAKCLGPSLAAATRPAVMEGDWEKEVAKPRGRQAPGKCWECGGLSHALFIHTCGLARLSSEERPASYQKVKHQGDLIKSSLQETISISMPNFMQIH